MAECKCMRICFHKSCYPDLCTKQVVTVCLLCPLPSCRCVNIRMDSSVLCLQGAQNLWNQNVIVSDSPWRCGLNIPLSAVIIFLLFLYVYKEFERCRVIHIPGLSRNAPSIHRNGNTLVMHWQGHLNCAAFPAPSVPAPASSNPEACWWWRLYGKHIFTPRSAGVIFISFPLLDFFLIPG